MSGARRRTLQGWLQERQYATPYHWRQRPNDEHEYMLRTQVVLELAGIAAPPHGAPARPALLDVGCGDGRFTADAARHARSVGVDVSRRALGHARALVADARFVASCGAALPFRDAAFDLVTMLDVIEHVPDEHEQQVIDESRRVLRPGGRIVVSTNTDCSARELKHYRHYPIDRFRALFDGFHGLTMVGLVPYFPTLRIWMAMPIVWRLARPRIRRCAPEEAQVVIAAAVKL